jgi:hypothetical protein
MMHGCSAMIAETSRMTPPPFSPNRQHVAAFFCHDERGNFKKVNEQYGNVYENKGSSWKTRGQSGNVYENKGT